LFGGAKLQKVSRGDVIGAINSLKLLPTLVPRDVVKILQQVSSGHLPSWCSSISWWSFWVILGAVAHHLKCLVLIIYGSWVMPDILQLSSSVYLIRWSISIFRVTLALSMFTPTRYDPADHQFLLHEVIPDDDSIRNWLPSQII